MRFLLNTFGNRPFALVLLPCAQFPSFSERAATLFSEASPAALRSKLRLLAGSADERSAQAAVEAASKAAAHEAAAAACLAACAQAGLPTEGPLVRILAPADVDGSEAHPAVSYLKAAFGDNSDVAGNFGKFVVNTRGQVVLRAGPLLPMAMLVRSPCGLKCFSLDLAHPLSQKPALAKAINAAPDSAGSPLAAPPPSPHRADAAR